MIDFKMSDREADSFNGYRAFLDKVTRDTSRESDTDRPEIALVDRLEKSSASIDVALNDMSAKARHRRDGSFKIHGRAYLETA